MLLKLYRFLIPFSGFLALAFLIKSCGGGDDSSNPTTDDVSMNDDDLDDLDQESKTSGFVIVGVTDDQKTVVKYMETLPTGIFDLSDGTNFEQFVPTSIYDHALYMPKPDGSSGFSKFVVNSEGVLKEEKVIGTNSQNFTQIAVKDPNIGVFQDRDALGTISIFNPQSFEVTGSIDMSVGFVPGGIDYQYARFIFRDDDVFASIRPSNDNILSATLTENDFFTSFVLHQANLMTNTFIDDTMHDGDGMTEIGFFPEFGQSLTDVAGNLYVPDAGGVGLAGRINKIPSGSNKIDPNYVFEPATVLNSINLIAPTFNAFTIVNDQIALARVNSDVPQEVLLIILFAGGVENLTDEQREQIITILLNAETARWCRLDLLQRTVVPISGLPPVSTFSIANTFEADGEMYVPITTETANAYYRWNPTNGALSKAFDVIGADILAVYNIANNN